MNKNIKKEAPLPVTGKSVTSTATGQQEVPVVKKGYAPGVALMSAERELATQLQQIRKALIVQGKKGAFKIEKLPNGMFSIKTLQFSGETKPAQMSAATVIHGISELTGGQFNVVQKENKSMDNTNIVKKDLLRRKIKEHFTKYPKSKSVLVSVNIGENKTIWKVDKIKSGYNVVEVNTRKEQFTLEAPLTPTQPPAATQQGSAEFKQIMGLVGPIMGNLGTPQTQAVSARNQINSLIGRVKNPKERAQAGAFLNYLGALTGGQMAGASPQAPIAQAPGSVPTPSGKTGLAAGKSIKGKKIYEKDETKEPEKKDEKKPVKKEKTPSSKSVKPEKEIGPASPISASEPDPVATGIETGSTPEMPPQEEPTTEPEAPEAAPKTGEELSLQSLAKTKPIKDIQVFGDDKGGHIMLSLGGLKNPIQLNFGYDGKITYKFGDLSRVLKVGK